MAHVSDSMNEKFTILRSDLGQYHFDVRVSEQGTVVSVGDGIVWIKGLPTAAIDQLISFEEGSRALVFHLSEDLVGAILLEQSEKLTAGTIAYHANLPLSIAVGDELLGRVVDPLGLPLDGQTLPSCKNSNKLDILAPPIVNRDFVSKPLYTGNKIVDNLIPIGKGQRELLIGDNGLGKSALAIDVVINQKDKNILCVYVLIGQNRSNIANTIQILKDTGAIEHTVIVVAEATHLPGLKYLAPFAGCAIAEWWMKAGQDTLIVYDDLTAHAASYRELSLLMRRPPGREAYPADIFYLHARLLERATCLSAQKGGGSMTALPIIETNEGEISTYIPTNLISITDGQVFFDEKLYSSGFLPAIDISKSVSRVGGNAQHPAIKKEAARMKYDYLQFLELEVFTRFGTKIDPTMQQKLWRGRILREILKQDRFELLDVTFQLAWMIAYNEGLFDKFELEQIHEVLTSISQKVKVSDLDLTVDRQKWLSQINSWSSEL